MHTSPQLCSAPCSAHFLRDAITVACPFVILVRSRRLHYGVWQNKVADSYSVSFFHSIHLSSVWFCLTFTHVRLLAYHCQSSTIINQLLTRSVLSLDISSPVLQILLVFAYRTLFTYLLTTDRIQAYWWFFHYCFHVTFIRSSVLIDFLKIFCYSSVTPL